MISRLTLSIGGVTLALGVLVGCVSVPPDESVVSDTDPPEAPPLPEMPSFAQGVDDYRVAGIEFQVVNSHPALERTSRPLVFHARPVFDGPIPDDLAGFRLYSVDHEVAWTKDLRDVGPWSAAIEYKQQMLPFQGYFTMDPEYEGTAVTTGPFTYDVLYTDGRRDTGMTRMPLPGSRQTPDRRVIYAEEYDGAVGPDHIPALRRARVEAAERSDGEIEVTFSVDDPRVDTGRIVLRDRDRRIIAESTYFVDTNTAEVLPHLNDGERFNVEGGENRVVISGDNFNDDGLYGGFTGGQAIEWAHDVYVYLIDGAQHWLLRRNYTLYRHAASRSEPARLDGTHNAMPQPETSGAEPVEWNTVPHDGRFDDDAPIHPAWERKGEHWAITVGTKSVENRHHSLFLDLDDGSRLRYEVDFFVDPPVRPSELERVSIVNAFDRRTNLPLSHNDQDATIERFESGRTSWITLHRTAIATINAIIVSGNDGRRTTEPLMYSQPGGWYEERAYWLYNEEYPAPVTPYHVSALRRANIQQVQLTASGGKIAFTVDDPRAVGGQIIFLDEEGITTASTEEFIHEVSGEPVSWLNDGQGLFRDRRLNVARITPDVLDTGERFDESDTVYVVLTDGSQDLGRDRSTVHISRSKAQPVNATDVVSPEDPPPVPFRPGAYLKAEFAGDSGREPPPVDTAAARGERQGPLGGADFAAADIRVLNDAPSRNNLPSLRFRARIAVDPETAPGPDAGGDYRITDAESRFWDDSTYAAERGGLYDQSWFHSTNTSIDGAFLPVSGLKLEIAPDSPDSLEIPLASHPPGGFADHTPVGYYTEEFEGLIGPGHISALRRAHIEEVSVNGSFITVTFRVNDPRVHTGYVRIETTDGVLVSGENFVHRASGVVSDQLRDGQLHTDGSTNLVTLPFSDIDLTSEEVERVSVYLHDGRQFQNSPYPDRYTHHSMSEWVQPGETGSVADESGLAPLRTGDFVRSAADAPVLPPLPPRPLSGSRVVVEPEHAELMVDNIHPEYSETGRLRSLRIAPRLALADYDAPDVSLERMRVMARRDVSWATGAAHLYDKDDGTLYRIFRLGTDRFSRRGEAIAVSDALIDLDFADGTEYRVSLDFSVPGDVKNAGRYVTYYNEDYAGHIGPHHVHALHRGTVDSVQIDGDDLLVVVTVDDGRVHHGELVFRDREENQVATSDRFYAVPAKTGAPSLATDGSPSVLHIPGGRSWLEESYDVALRLRDGPPVSDADIGAAYRHRSTGAPLTLSDQE